MSAYSQEKMWSDFRVGLITFAGLALLVLGVIFAGGDKGLLFQKTSIVKAHLLDVGGLKKGSSVTLLGMAVGRVTDIGFATSVNPGESVVEVVMEVRSDVRARIKKDSVPVVRTQGMLGDRYIDIFGGTAVSEPLPEGEALVGDAATDFDKTLREATEVLDKSDKVLLTLNDLMQDFKKNPRRYFKFSVF